MYICRWPMVNGVEEVKTRSLRSDDGKGWGMRRKQQKTVFAFPRPIQHPTDDDGKDATPQWVGWVPLLELASFFCSNRALSRPLRQETHFFEQRGSVHSVRWRRRTDERDGAQFPPPPASRSCRQQRTLIRRRRPRRWEGRGMNC